MTLRGKGTGFLHLAGWTAAALLAAALPAAAHPGHGPMSGFAAGVQHPLSGMDHLLAMIAVGLWAGLCGSRREWLWPATFVSSMVAGGIIGMHATITIPVEPVILASGNGARPRHSPEPARTDGPGGMLIAVFGMAHGYAHCTEIPQTAQALDFGAGFTLMTAALHAMGVMVAAGLRRLRLDIVTRFTGVGIAMAGIGLILGV
jgi:urease accessory protein